MACVRKRRGKWVVDFRDGAGIRHWKTYETKRAAEDYLAKAIPEARQWSQSAIDHGVTLDQYAERWFELIRSTIKPRSYTRYEELWRVHLKPAFGGIKVRHLQRGIIMRFLARKLTENLARNTVRNIHATLRAML